MERLDYSEFVAARRDFDAVVELSGDLAGSCWWSPWQMAAHDAMGPAGDERRHLIYRSDRAWLALVEYEIPGVFVPFEQTWMFGCPLVGEPLAALQLLSAVTQEHRGELRGLMLGGLPKNGPLRGLLRSATAGGYGEQDGTESCIIDLSEGVDAWLARRSRNFRRTIRRAEIPGDVTVEDGLALTADEAFQRMLVIQARSHKALGEETELGGDIFAVPMYHDFYRRLLVDVHASGELRMSIAARDGVDLAFHFGFARGHHYRGYQMGYIEAERSLGLGTALQIRHLRQAAAEGVTRYDMGMLAPYKERWCDRIEHSVVAALR